MNRCASVPLRFYRAAINIAPILLQMGKIHNGYPVHLNLVDVEWGVTHRSPPPKSKAVKS